LLAAFAISDNTPVATFASRLRDRGDELRESLAQGLWYKVLVFKIRQRRGAKWHQRLS